jgi:hypothetical protein
MILKSILRIIKINNINKLTNPHNIKLTKKLNVETYEPVKLLNNDIFYDAINLITPLVRIGFNILARSLLL